MSRVPNTIETASGIAFDYFDPVVTVEDIARGLAHAPRFIGQTSAFLSVAEHSLIVHSLVARMDPQLAMAALFHDAHEAYIGDMPTPLKAIVGDSFKDIARTIDVAVADLLGLDVEDLKHPVVKAADDISVAYEASYVMSGPGWSFTHAMSHAFAEEAWPGPVGLSSAEAEALFLETHEVAARGR